MKNLRFTAEMGSFGLDLESMSDDELRKLIERECSIPVDNIEEVEVR